MNERISVLPNSQHSRTREFFADRVANRGEQQLRFASRTLALLLTAALAACSPQKGDDHAGAGSQEGGALFRVGSIVVYQTDLDHELGQRRARPGDSAARKKALEDLATRAQFAQAALDAKLDRDPAVREQTARILASRLKEQTLAPRVKNLAGPIPEARLRELYQAGIERYRSDEKRQIAVLWLNPGADPARVKQYEEKLGAARDWFFKNGDVKDHPEQGFSVLSVDYSEHAASRFKGGVIGWFERAGGMADPWSKAAAEIAFSLKEPGEVSAVTTRPEGVFLVRYMAMKPAVVRSFESVTAELESAERQRMRTAVEMDFDQTVKSKHPVEWLTPHD